jgi:hypothetical protein
LALKQGVSVGVESSGSVGHLVCRASTCLPADRGLTSSVEQQVGTAWLAASQIVYKNYF